PELQVPVDAVRTVSRRGAVAGGVDWHLFAEDLDSRRGCGEFFAAQVGVVEAEIVIVFRPIRRRLSEESHHPRETELLVPLATEFGQGLRRGRCRVIVVNDVSGSD